MPRPVRCRRIFSDPSQNCFKPRGVPLSELGEIQLSLDEFEAIRLADSEGLYQEEAAKVMGVSRQTFGNILISARKKVAHFLAGGNALNIGGGVVELKERSFICPACNHEFVVTPEFSVPDECPECKSDLLWQGRGRKCHGFGKGRGRDKNRC